MPRSIKDILLNRWTFATLAFLFIQELVIASSTLWLVYLMQAVQSGGAVMLYLGLYLVSLTIPSLSSGASLVMKSRWIQHSLRSFAEAFIETHKSKVAHWNNHKDRQEKLSILTAEGQTTLTMTIDYMRMLMWYIFSVTFGILTLSLVVEPAFAVAYGCSMIGVYFLMRAQAKKRARLVREAQGARIDVTQSLLSVWDNVLLGNQYNFTLWLGNTVRRLNNSVRQNVRSETFEQVIAVAISTITLLPSMVVILNFITAHIHEPLLLAPFVVALPRLFQILEYTYECLVLLFQWTMHKNKLLVVKRVLEVTKDEPSLLEQRISWNKIRITPSNNGHATILSEEDRQAIGHPALLREKLNTQPLQSGRLTVRGENGCGKSTLLQLIKKDLGDRAFYLPAQHHLAFTVDTSGASTGESLRRRLEEMQNNVDAEVLLLDEWDANLDEFNQQRLSELIEQVSQKKLVVEVRHR
jgi:ABC-type transport system involved in cytochrome bd biosynthesis fused ATPase/permease subunit